HPALSWYFRKLFERYFPENSGEADRARHAFAAAMSILGNTYHGAIRGGHGSVLLALAADEENLLAALRLARLHRWSDFVIGPMQGLQMLYLSVGLRSNWRRLVDEVVPEFIDPVTDNPLPGREAQWSILTEYRVGLASDDRQLEKAEQLQSACVKW